MSFREGTVLGTYDLTLLPRILGLLQAADPSGHFREEADPRSCRRTASSVLARCTIPDLQP